jgi:hypothetical protein
MLINRDGAQNAKNTISKNRLRVLRAVAVRL